MNYVSCIISFLIFIIQLITNPIHRYKNLQSSHCTHRKHENHTIMAIIGNDHVDYINL